jgi:hypothetical protein
MKINLLATNGQNPATGYGKMELGLQAGFKAIDADVAVYTHNTRRKRRKSDVTLIVGYASWLSMLHSGRTWLYTMSETTKPSANWIENINRYCERVFVPAPALCGYYQNAGVECPVHFVPLGTDWNTPRYHIRRKEEPFIWLTYSLGDTRKGVDLAMLAFQRLFGGDMRHRMIIKCRDNPNWLTGLQNPQIELVSGQTTDDEWYQVLNNAHAFIFASRGEGYGLPPREATLTGLPTIATQWLGMYDVDKWGFPIGVKGLKPAPFDNLCQEANGKGAYWSEPKSTDLDRQLQYVYSHYDAALDKASAGRAYLLTRHTWKTTACQLAHYV